MLEKGMSRLLEFPVDYPAANNGQVARTFVTLAVPPRHDLVTHVFAWVFHRDDVLLIRQNGEWALPYSERRPDETFAEALERALDDHAGVALDQMRMVGTIKLVDHAGDDPFAGRATYQPWFIATAAGFDEEHADDRMLIEPGLVRAYLRDWTPLMDEMLAFAQAARMSSGVTAGDLEGTRTAA